MRWPWQPSPQEQHTFDVAEQLISVLSASSESLVQRADAAVENAKKETGGHA